MKIKGNVFSVLNKIRIFFFLKTRYDFHEKKPFCNNKLNIQVYINT